MDLTREWVILGIDSIILGVCLRMYLKIKKVSDIMEDITVHTDSEKLREMMISRGEKVLPFVAVRGTVQSLGAPISIGNNADAFGVIQKITLKEHLVSRATSGFWTQHTRFINESYNSIPFSLCTENGTVEVLQPFDAQILDLETIVDKFETNSPGLRDYVWGFFVGMRQRGVQTTEEVLKEGTLITGFGELSISKYDGGLELQPPTDGNPYYITALPVSSLIYKLEYQKRIYRWLSIVFTAVGVSILGFAAYQWWKSRSRRSKDEELHQTLERNRIARRRHEREENTPPYQLCVVCHANPREIILLPCGHVCICEDCNLEITTNCPVCRVKIEVRAPAFIS